jgi:uncharacterized protein (DUF433 family)
MGGLHTSLLDRITTNPEVRFGKPCIRGHRITVQEVLEWLATGASQQQILADYPQLQPEDFLAVYAYAAELAGSRASGEWSSSWTKAFRRGLSNCYAISFLSLKALFETGLLVWATLRFSNTLWPAHSFWSRRTATSRVFPAEFLIPKLLFSGLAVIRRRSQPKCSGATQSVSLRSRALRHI